MPCNIEAVTLPYLNIIYTYEIKCKFLFSIDIITGILRVCLELEDIYQSLYLNIINSCTLLFSTVISTLTALCLVTTCTSIGVYKSCDLLSVIQVLRSMCNDLSPGCVML